MTQREYAQFFKDPHVWKEDLVAVGGDFSPDRLLYAYSHGIFPWSENPIHWYSLDPRAIFDLQNVHFSRTILRKIRRNQFRISYNEAFKAVMQGCAYREKDSTWITPGFFKGYQNLHRLGYAHSVEAWNEKNELVGGVYGVALGKFFAGESMFAYESDAGKITLYHLFEKLKASNFSLFDTQQLNHVTWSLGAYEIPKSSYLQRLETAVGNLEPWIIPP
ncbi:leucyl/phenylalanyl-tRNA--protein transferase [Leptospira ognonensis]|uniref:Leucyl/phenylalanyl-tRNA--protein transferase n=1 Tax=Leptospira ognonensis TaxID=2484945 RepID=A0A4R9K6S8_9LEPT|nr:leucyl/phenylalanyl-tRNA--protein transferase [Leptospira ognonensis]TGL60277.1 leucyl/phenylalanyl-tRNA--protein transferase [Leptospira ognonensis]